MWILGLKGQIIDKIQVCGYGANKTPLAVLSKDTLFI